MDLNGDINFNNLQLLGTFCDYSDGTIKNIFTSCCGIIEMTFIQNKSHQGVDVFCAPSHHYCNLGCTICHLSNPKKNKEMLPVSADEFIEAQFRTKYKKSLPARLVNNQVLDLNDNTEYDKALRRSEHKKALISWMGVGEPLLNFSLIQQVYDQEPLLKRLGDYKMISYALSTIMPNDSLRDILEYVLAKQMPLKIHYSLFSPFSEENFILTPATKIKVEEALVMLEKYSTALQQVPEIMDNLNQYHKISEPVEIHYTLVEGLNDSELHLNKLIELLKKYPIPLKILGFNPVANLKSSQENNKWLAALHNFLPDLRIIAYSAPGSQINSSCGQFTRGYYLPETLTCQENIEFAEWQDNYRIKE